MSYLEIVEALRVMPRHYYIIFYAPWIFNLFNVCQPAEIYTLKSQLSFLGISAIFSFVIGFIFGARMKIYPY